jgi:hypothetical protein
MHSGTHDMQHNDTDLAAEASRPRLAGADRSTDDRLTFDDDAQILEIDLEDAHFATTREVNAFYDQIEECIARSGEDLWFFLIDYAGCRIDPGAWVAWARRGKTLNLGHSMGTVRYDPTPATRAQIERAAGTDAFDPNLFAERDQALARLHALPSRRTERIVHTPTHSAEEIAARVRFIDDEEILEVDMSDFTFHHARDVDDLYDHLENAIKATDRKWFFLVNYNGCRILPPAWLEFARRGRDLNEAASLGTVRFAAGSETEADIRLRAESGGFRPNIRNSREEALDRIAELKAERG